MQNLDNFKLVVERVSSTHVLLSHDVIIGQDIQYHYKDPMGSETIKTTLSLRNQATICT